MVDPEPSNTVLM